MTDTPKRIYDPNPRHYDGLELGDQVMAALSDGDRIGTVHHLLPATGEVLVEFRRAAGVFYKLVTRHNIVLAIRRDNT